MQVVYFAFWGYNAGKFLSCTARFLSGVPFIMDDTQFGGAAIGPIIGNIEYKQLFRVIEWHVIFRE